jgi:type VI secretion system protein ImpJ
LTTNGSDLPDLIEWHEGMLLTPQHFQQFATRSELLTHFMFTQTSPFAWGVIDLKIDEAALAGGVLRILKIDAILPDGLLALGGIEHGVRLELDVQKVEENPARIYLAAPREAALYDRTDYSRYEAVVKKDELTADDVSQADPAIIPRIRPRLRLTASQSDLGSMTALPIIEFSAEGTVLKQTEYVPPRLRIKSGSSVANSCARVRKALRETATNLASKLRPDAQNSDLAGLHQLQGLVSGLPRFESMLESEQVHPYALYLALTSIAGGAAFLCNAHVPPIFRPYDHNDLLASFREVVQFIQLALSEGLVENWTGNNFSLLKADKNRTGIEDRREPTYAIGPSLEKIFGAQADFTSTYLGLMLRLPASVSPDSMIEWGESCILASEDAIADLKLSRSRGAVCERVDFLEDLVAAPGSILFRVKNDAKWIDPQKKLVLKPAKQETRMPEVATLFVKKRSTSERGS